MKTIFRILITAILKWKAKRFLKKHRVQVIAITGSMGKSSTRQAIYTLLKKHFDVYSSPEGFNTEIGMSLAILQEEESGFSSIVKWFKILKHVFFEKKNPYQKIILEMGADCPGDIKKLVKIAPPKIGIITGIAPVHLGKGQFKNVHEIAKEKNQLIAHLRATDTAIVNEDDVLVAEMKTGGKRVTFGTKTSAELRASDIVMTEKSIRFTVHFKGREQNFRVPVLGAFQIHVLLPAIAVGLELGLSLEQCAEALTDFKLPPGRMNPIPGMNDSHIIDSSYNASPKTVEAALELMEGLQAERKIVALGTMNELGEMSKDAHLTIGKRAANVGDLFIFVGPEATTLKKAITDAGISENKIYTFFDSEEAGHFLKTKIEPGDLILVKGSQNRVRMEKLVKVIMKQPEKAKALLCRQEEEWKNK